MRPKCRLQPRRCPKSVQQIWIFLRLIILLTRRRRFGRRRRRPLMMRTAALLRLRAIQLLYHHVWQLLALARFLLVQLCEDNNDMLKGVCCCRYSSATRRPDEPIQENSQLGPDKTPWRPRLRTHSNAPPPSPL